MSARQICNRATGKTLAMALAMFVMCCALATQASAQDAPYFAPPQLDRMVSRIALYPDALLAQTLAAATFPDQISDASYWADEHRGMGGNELAAEIQDDQLPWDPSVQALLPFPAVLHMMASDMDWTTDLGNAFLGQQQEVMYAVQRMRRRAFDYGYLRTGPQIIVGGGPYITIMPARVDYVVVPTYDPVVVYERPRAGFFIGGAIGFRFGVVLGASYRPWGWGYNRIAWDRRVVFINNAPWQRTWVNRHEYHHPYTVRYYPEHHYDRDRENHGREVSYRAHERNEERREERHESHVREERREDHAREERREDRREDHAREDRHEDHGRVDYRHEDHGHDVAHENHGRDDHSHDVAQNRGHEDHSHDVAQNRGHDNGNHGNQGHDNGNHGQNNGNHGHDNHDDKGDKGDKGNHNR
ncbi:MAG TPA: DUF3300 domain-containing protein [Candidatus Angelobacter sp.]|nr:DUF3300 domain-containing protein [Candidatus Angelobacter sp.]